MSKELSEELQNLILIEVNRIAASMAEPIQELMYCESIRLYLKPGTLYRFTVDPNCGRCTILGKHAEFDHGAIHHGERRDGEDRRIYDRAALRYRASKNRRKVSTRDRRNELET